MSRFDHTADQIGATDLGEVTVGAPQPEALRELTRALVRLLLAEESEAASPAPGELQAL